MTDEQGPSDQPEKQKEGKAEFWFGVVEFGAWMIEGIVWLVRVLVAGVVALLHACS